MKRIAMTGPTGAIGIALIEKCILEGVEVYAFCRRDSKRMDRIPRHKLVHIVSCNLQELANVYDEHFLTCDVFYHLGWEAPSGSGRNNLPLQIQNIQYTLDAVTLAERLGCTVFIGAGSQAEYGRQEKALNAQTPVFPENGYGMAKLCAGQMSRIACEKLGISHIWVRILSVYGPYDGTETMIISTITKLLAGERPPLTEGRQEWDYLYSADAGNALFLLGTKGKKNQIYCLGSGTTRPLIDYIETIKNTIDPSLELGVGKIPYGEKQIMYLCADIQKLTEDTGFLPRVAFTEGIQETIEWVKTQLCESKTGG